MIEKEIQLVTSYLDKVADKIGVGANKIWPWLVKQQYVEAIWPTVLVLIFSMAAIISSRWVRREVDKYKEANEKSRYDADETMRNIAIVVFVIFCMGIAGSLIAFIAEFSDIFNPEYWALMDILRQIK